MSTGCWRGEGSEVEVEVEDENARRAAPLNENVRGFPTGN
jgi:hypothetical protein